MIHRLLQLRSARSRAGDASYFESPYRQGEIITVDEYYQWIFENSVPGLPEAAEKEELTPLDYMRKYGAFEVKKENYTPFDNPLPSTPETAFTSDEQDRALDPSGGVVGLMVDGQRYDVGKPEFYLETLRTFSKPCADE